MLSKRSMCVMVLLAGLAASAPLASATTQTFNVTETFPARPGGTVVVDVSFHEVEVRVRDAATVEITVDLQISASASKAERLIEDYKPVFSTHGSEIRVRSTATERGLFSWSGSSKKGRVYVEMPSGMNLKVDGSSGSCEVGGDFGDGRVVVDLSSGSTAVDGTMSELVVDASSGSVTADLHRPVESVRIDTSSGSVRVHGPAADIRVDTSSGSVTLSGLAGSAKIDTSSGGVKAAWDLIPAGSHVGADTSSGSVRLTFPAGTVLAGAVDTSSGGISSDFGGDRSDRGHHLKLDGGPGEVRVVVDTSSGGVKLIEK